MDDKERFIEIRNKVSEKISDPEKILEISLLISEGYLEQVYWESLVPILYLKAEDDTAILETKLTSYLYYLSFITEEQEPTIYLQIGLTLKQLWFLFVIFLQESKKIAEILGKGKEISEEKIRSVIDAKEYMNGQELNPAEFLGKKYYFDHLTINL